MFPHEESFDFSQAASAQWHSDSSTNVSPSTFDMMAANPFDLAAEQQHHQTMAGPFNPFVMFDHTFPTDTGGPLQGQMSGEMPSSQHSDGDSPDANWTSINSARGSFSSIATDDSMLEQHMSLSSSFDGLPITDQPKRRRRRNLDPKVRHSEKLEKNRRAAERCRQKQRAYVGALQERAREEEIRRARLIAQVDQLRDAILSLKESMVSHSGCHDERIKQYLLLELGKNTQRRMSGDSAVSTPAVTPGAGGYPFPMHGQPAFVMPIA
jgi:hypothetical protein